MPIVANTNEEYHASEGVSKSGLWELYTKTPFHYRYVEKEQSAAQEIGAAAHAAILEPEQFESLFYRGPDDRRGNKWKDALDFAEHHGMTAMTSTDYDIALALRETAASIPELDIMLSGNRVIEQSAYAVDEETGLLVRCRVDVFNKDHGLICDLKSATNASEEAFRRAVENFGYHVQDPMYQEIWQNGGGGNVNGFFFVVIEKSNPPTIAVYELDAPSVTEGHAIYRAALHRYKDCVASGNWPSYPGGAQKIGIRPFAYKLTPAPGRE